MSKDGEEKAVKMRKLCHSAESDDDHDDVQIISVQNPLGISSELTCNRPIYIDISGSDEDDNRAYSPVVKDELKYSSFGDFPESCKVIDISKSPVKVEPMLTCVQINFLHDKNELPIYCQPTKMLQTHECISTLLSAKLDKAAICTQTPFSVEINSVFVVDLNHLHSPKDILCDDMGVWKWGGSYRKWCEVDDDGTVSVLNEKSLSVVNCYRVWKRYYSLKASPDVKRLIVMLEDHEEDMLNLTLVQYLFTKGEHRVTVAPHGNSRSSEPFFRTKPSILTKLKDQAKTKTPKRALKFVYEDSGGIVNASSAGSLPRNRQQVKDIRRAKYCSNDWDPLYAVMYMCKEGEGNSKNSFVQMVNAAPYPMMLLAFNYMLDDLVRFCTSDSNFSVLGIDPTFSLGEFDVTVTTYRHLLLIPHREPTGKPPVMIGPLFVHLKKNFGTYHFFSSSLVSLRKELSSLKAFGTDGEIALERAFKTTFTKAIHLRCFLHFRGNIEQKLRDLSIPSTVSKEIVKDIMGCPSRLELGLVDAQDSAQFDEMLLSLEKRWNEFEAPYNSPPKFYEWFKCNSQDVITRFMIRDVRESAGLGSPPEPYYTNEVESMNKLLKEEVNYKSSQLPDFVEKMKVMLYQQRQEIECALIDSGQYRVASGYESLRVDSSQWFRMTAEQRSRKIDCFMKAVVHDRHAPTTYSSPLEKLNLPHHLKESLWKKAHDLANHDSQITNAPGEESAWMVKSYTARQPHFVQSSKCRGGFLCDMQCLSYKSSKICSHTLAVAMKMGCLEKFLHWYEMKKHQPNFTALAEVGKLSTTGKKSSRKGITKKNSKIVKKFVTEAAETGWSNRCLQKDGSQNPFSVNISNNSHVQISSNNNYTPEPPPLPLLILTPPPTQSSQLSTPAPFRQQGRPSVETPFWVAFIFGNVSRCRGKYSEARIKVHFHLIVLGHKEYVIFQTSYSPVFQQSWDKCNVYYHPQKTCIEPNFCDFNPLHHISISEPVKARLLYEHKMLLQSEFGLIV